MKKRYDDPKPGEKCNKLTVIREAQDRSYKGERQYICACTCGRICTVDRYDLVTKQRVSCGGCYGTNKAFDPILLDCYKNMIARCYNPQNPNYKNYGDRGIEVDPEWLDPINGFINFVIWSYANGFKPGLSLDRKDNNGNYGPSNCRWTINLIQQTNKRFKASNTGFQGIHRTKHGTYFASISVNNKTVGIG